MAMGAKSVIELDGSVRMARLTRPAGSAGTRLLWRQQSSSQQIQVGQREGGEQPRGVLGQAAVAHLGEAPQALDHVKCMFHAGPGRGATTVDEPLIVVQRSTRGTPIDSVANAGGLGALPVRLVPISLIAKHLAFLAVQQLGDLRAVVHVVNRR